MKNIKQFSFSGITCSLLVFLFFALAPQTAFATHCDATFTTDIGPILPPSGVGIIPGDCTGNSGCNDYFDLSLNMGDMVFLSFCAPGATGSFDTGLSVWSGAGFTTLEACNDDFCGLLSELPFTAPATDIYRFRIGGFGGGSGTYMLAIDSPATSATTPVPTLGQWGMILLVLLTLTFGMVFMTSRSRQLAGAAGGNMSMGSVFSNMPFNAGAYGRFLMVTFALVALGFALAVALLGYSLTGADIPGVLICTPVLAYLGYLLLGDKS